MNRNLVNSKLDKYRERGKGTYTFCQVGCDCNIAVNLLEKCENLQSKIDKAIDKINQYELIVGYYDSNYDEYDDTYSHNTLKEELNDILKEDK